MKRRPWTADDDAHLRRFHAEGKNDVDIAYILNRKRQVVQLHRVALGLPAVARHTSSGWRTEARVKMVEENRRRLADPEYLARARARMAKANEIRLAGLPEIGTAEHKHYHKVRRYLGARAARAHLIASV